MTEGFRPSRHLREILVGDWRDAEELACWHMANVLNYPNARLTKSGADGGIDVVSDGGVAQVKFYTGPVGAPAIQQAVGAGFGSPQVLFYTTTGFSKAAKQFAKLARVALFTFNIYGDVEPANRIARTLVRDALPPGVWEARARAEEAALAAKLAAAAAEQEMAEAAYRAEVLRDLRLRRAEQEGRVDAFVERLEVEPELVESEQLAQFLFVQCASVLDPEGERLPAWILEIARNGEGIDHGIPRDALDFGARTAEDLLAVRTAIFQHIRRPEVVPDLGALVRLLDAYDTNLLNLTYLKRLFDDPYQASKVDERCGVEAEMLEHLIEHADLDIGARWSEGATKAVKAGAFAALEIDPFRRGRQWCLRALDRFANGGRFCIADEIMRSDFSPVDSQEQEPQSSFVLAEIAAQLIYPRIGYTDLPLWASGIHRRLDNEIVRVARGDHKSLQDWLRLLADWEVERHRSLPYWKGEPHVAGIPIFGFYADSKADGSLAERWVRVAALYDDDALARWGLGLYSRIDRAIVLKVAQIDPLTRGSTWVIDTLERIGPAFSPKDSPFEH